jgi:hypothetical protein
MTWRNKRRAGGERKRLGGEDEGAMKWEKPLKSSEALKGKRRGKSSQFNARRWTIQKRGVLRGHVIDALHATLQEKRSLRWS